MTEPRKRIALLVNTLSSGGTERTVSNLSRQLSAFFDVDILVNDDRCIDFPYSGTLISLGIPSDRDRLSVTYQLRALYQRTRRLRMLRREKHYAAVLSFSEMTNLSNVLTRKCCSDRDQKTIISCRNPVRKNLGRGWKFKLAARSIIPYCLRRADITVSCSREIADELMKEFGLPPERSRVICNGLDADSIRRQSAEPLPEVDEAWMSRGYQVISAGRLTMQKGQWHLIRAVNRLRSEGMNIRLMILGEGELRKKLESLIAELKPGGGVRLRGFTANPYAYMAHADVVVFPSQYEGFSNAMAEALCCGVPCISTDHATGAREILSPASDFHQKVTDTIDHADHGMLVPVCEDRFQNAKEPLSAEEELMADAIREILTDPELKKRYQSGSVKRAAQLDIRTVIQQWVRLIDDTEDSR